MPEWHATAHETERAEAHWGLTHAPERKKHWALRSASSAAATLSRKLVSTATANY